MVARREQSGGLFAGPDAISSACRKVDWAATSIGPIDSWPASLRAVVRLCLRSRIPTAVCAGPELLLIYNEGYAALLGPGRHPWALGRPAGEVWADAREGLHAELTGVMERCDSLIEVDRRIMLDRGGERVDAYFVHSLTPIVEDDGAVVGVLDVLRETTERVRAERDLRRMFELSHDLLAVGTHDRFRMVNPAFTRVLGWSEAEMLAQPGSYFVHPDDLDSTHSEIDELARGQPTIRFENRYRHKDGSYRRLSWTASPVSEDGLIYAAARDVTELEQAEENERRATATAAFRLRLADALRSLADPHELQVAAARVLGEALGATRVGYVRVSEDGQHGIVRAEYRVAGARSIVGRHRLDDYGRALTDELRAGRTIVIDDLDDPRLTPSERAASVAFGVGAMVAVPLIKQGRAVALLAVHQDRPRAWTPTDVGSIEDTAERTWAAVERASADEARRESEERLRQTLRYAAAGVFDWNIDTGEIFWSPENYELHGVDPAETIRLARWKQAVHPDDRSSASAAIRAAIADDVPEFRAEYRVLHPERGLRWLLGVGKIERGSDGRPVRFRGLSLDITERREAEQEAREADRRKTEFLAVLSHELRNPLAPIRNSIELLASTPPSSELATRAMQILARQSAHLSHIVDDLLDITRISHGKVVLDRELLDLRDVVRKTADDLRSTSTTANVELCVELVAGPILIDADATRIAQVVTNLLTNAIKFAPGGRVTVSVDVEPGVAILLVRDTGVGMLPDELQRMFDPFAQAEQPIARTLGGLGLGLALVKSLVELHGGSVRAHSDGLGRGTEFAVRLPLAAGQRNRSGRTRERASARVRRVLVVEDNVDAGQTLADLVRLRGHDVRLAFDGESGVGLAREFRPEVVICDIGLPDMTGYEFARALRSDAAHDSTVLIALSGYAQAEDRKRAREAGFDAHLPKPAPLDRLFALVCDDDDNPLDEPRIRTASP